MTGVILFRAQPFHLGHLHMVNKAYEDCVANNCDLYIFVGSADKSGTKRNPLPIDYRLMLIEGALHEHFELADLQHIHIFPLDDLTDEADNSHNWGRYLYMKMLSKTKDTDMTIYYSDNPQIMLSWFAQDERWCLRFKFLDRYQNISATNVRHYIDNDIILKGLVPNFVYINREEIRNFMKEVENNASK